jgi:hypothetical protein
MLGNGGGPLPLQRLKAEIHPSSKFVYCIPPHRKLGSNLLVIYQAINSGRLPAEFPADDEDEDGDASLLWNLLGSCWAIDPKERPTIDQVCTQFESTSERILNALELKKINGNVCREP